MDNERAQQFIRKAEQLLSWGDDQLEQMRSAGRQRIADKIEKNFWILLCLIDSAHQALADAAKKLDMGAWRDDLNRLRNEDPLLRYMMYARNSEVHDALVKWRPSMEHMNLRIVDAAKANKIVGPKRGRASVFAIFSFLYRVTSEAQLIEAMKGGTLPPEDLQRQAGVEVSESLNSLSLDDFEIGQGRKRLKISAPTSHRGNELPPSADQAVSLTLAFYKDKYEGLNAVAKAKVGLEAKSRA